MLRTLIRCLAAPVALTCCAANVFAQAAQKGATSQAADSGPFVGEFVLAACAVGLILWAVCAPSGKAT